MDKAQQIEELNAVYKQLCKDSKLESILLSYPSDDDPRNHAARHIAHRVREEVSKRLAVIDRSIETMIDLGFFSGALDISSFLYHHVLDLFDSIALLDSWKSCLEVEEEDADE